MGTGASASQKQRQATYSPRRWGSHSRVKSHLRAVISPRRSPRWSPARSFSVRKSSSTGKATPQDEPSSIRVNFPYEAANTADETIVLDAQSLEQLRHSAITTSHTPCVGKHSLQQPAHAEATGKPVSETGTTPNKRRLSDHGRELFQAIHSPMFSSEMEQRYGVISERAAVDQTFEILGTIGTGAYGKVHRARARCNQCTGRHSYVQGDMVAIKEIQLTQPCEAGQYYNDNESTEERMWKLLAEIDMLRKCSAAVNVVAFHENFVVAGSGAEGRPLRFLWIVMEYCDMGSVADVMEVAGGVLSVDCAQEIAFCVLAALDCIHRECEMIHRDVKPSNILLQSTGRCLLADFGVSANLEASNELRSTFVGTLPYMAPEIVKGIGYSSKVDIWGLGVSLIEILEGTTANHGLRKHSLLLKLLQGPELDLHQADNFPSSLRSFLTLTLDKDPLERPSAQLLLQHSFLSRVQCRQNTDTWLQRHPTPLSKLCHGLQHKLAIMLERKSTEASLEDMYGSTDSGTVPAGMGTGNETVRTLPLSPAHALNSSSNATSSSHAPPSSSVNWNWNSNSTSTHTLSPSSWRRNFRDGP